jgi:PAS domain S-box-containing protein
MAATRDGAGSAGDDAVAIEAALTRVSKTTTFAVRNNGIVAYVSPAVRDLLGFQPDEVVGTNVLDYLHPDDRERAVLALTWRDAEGQAGAGFTDFRARHCELGYVDVETTATNFVFDGEEHLAIYARPAPPQTAEELLALVVRGGSRVESLTKALASVGWREHGSHVAIAWPDEDGWQQVDTGLPEGLTGVQTGGTANPWAASLWTRRPVRRSVAEVDDATATLA